MGLPAVLVYKNMSNMILNMINMYLKKNLKRIFLLQGPYSEEPAGRADDGEARRVAARAGGAGR